MHLGVPAPIRQEAQDCRDLDRIVDRLRTRVRLAQDDDPGWLRRVKETFHGRQLGRLAVGHLDSLQVARGSDLDDAGHQSGQHSESNEQAGLVEILTQQQVVRAQPRHAERGCDHCAAHGVEVLRSDPRIEQNGPDVGDLHAAVGPADVAHRVLHPGVADDDEKAGQPRAEEHHHCRQPVHGLTEADFAEQEQPDECRLEEECERAFHGQALGDDVAGERRELRPICTELELQRDARDDAHDETHPKQPAPESHRQVRRFVAPQHGHRLEDYQEQGQAHRERRKKVVVRRRKSELDPR